MNVLESCDESSDVINFFFFVIYIYRYIKNNPFRSKNLYIFPFSTRQFDIGIGPQKAFTFRIRWEKCIFQMERFTKTQFFHIFKLRRPTVVSGRASPCQVLPKCEYSFVFMFNIRFSKTWYVKGLFRQTRTNSASFAYCQIKIFEGNVKRLHKANEQNKRCCSCVYIETHQPRCLSNFKRKKFIFLVSIKVQFESFSNLYIWLTKVSDWKLNCLEKVAFFVPKKNI